MHHLSQALETALQGATRVAPNAHLTFLRAACKEGEQAAASNPSLVPIIDELVRIAAGHNFALDSMAVNEFAQKLGESHFYCLCAAKCINLEKIPESQIKTPDFKWPCGPSPIHFEVKTLSVVDGERGIDNALESAFTAQVEIEDQLVSGKRVATAVSEIAPYAGKPYKMPRLVAVIDTLLEKTRGNVKQDQFALPNTFLVVNLSVIPPIRTEIQTYGPCTGTIHCSRRLSPAICGCWGSVRKEC